MKAQELRDQSVDELIARREETKRELFDIRNEQKRTRKSEKPHLLRVIKKNVAKINTILREKELAIR